MKISYNWIKELLPDLTADPIELAQKLTHVGLEVEGIHQQNEGLDQVVVAYVEDLEPHPNADKLKICKVKTDREEFQIVCGANNVEKGNYFPLAKIGAKLPNGLKIKPAKIRKVESFGMLCSESELGLAKESNGILNLKNSQPNDLGKNIAEFLNLNDTIIEIGITPNRGDCLSHYGVCRDIAAIYNLKLNILKVKDYPEKTSDVVEVKIADELCYRYASRIIRDVKVKPSPKWLKSRLESLDIRSINNVVDATNYIMMLTGHPVHAFDLSKIEKNQIIIRKAHQKEVLETLDGVKRELSEDHLVIADSKKALAIAGIMGGEESSVTDQTLDLVLEVASFDSSSIRKTAKNLSLSSDSSYRFERNVPMSDVKDVMELLTSLICDLSEGKASNQVVDISLKESLTKEIILRKTEVKRILGIEIEDQQIKNILSSLQLHIEDQTEIFKVKIPEFRSDLEREIDLIEEIIRFYGYDQLPSALPTLKIKPHYQNNSEKLEQKAKSFFVQNGFNETIHLSFISSYSTDLIGQDENTVKIINPLSQDMNCLRNSLLPQLIDCWKKNSNLDPYIQLFELRPIFKNNQQSLKLAGLLSGEISHQKWNQNKIKIDFYYLKGLIIDFFNSLGINKLDFLIEEKNYLHPGQTQTITCQKQALAFYGKLHPTFLDHLEIKQDLYFFEIDFDLLSTLIKANYLKYKDFSHYPVVFRDLAIIVDSTLDYQQIIDSITNSEIPWLKRIELFDLYEGEKVGRHKKSLSFNLVFENNDRTLTDEEVNESFVKLFHHLQKEMGASLREE